MLAPISDQHPRVAQQEESCLYKVGRFVLSWLRLCFVTPFTAMCWRLMHCTHNKSKWKHIFESTTDNATVERFQPASNCNLKPLLWRGDCTGRSLFLYNSVRNNPELTPEQHYDAMWANKEQVTKYQLQEIFRASHQAIPADLAIAPLQELQSRPDGYTLPRLERDTFVLHLQNDYQNGHALFFHADEARGQFFFYDSAGGGLFVYENKQELTTAFYFHIHTHSTFCQKGSMWEFDFYV